MARMQRSVQLVGQSYRVLMQDTALMLLPLMSGIVMAVVAGLAAFGPALQGVYVASPYRYATDGVAPDGVDRHLLASAFIEKDRR